MKITTYFKYINVERAKMLYTDLQKYLLYKVGSTSNQHHITQLVATVNILQIILLINFVIDARSLLVIMNIEDKKTIKP